MKRILLVDDHAVFRRGMADVIEEEPGLEICGSAGTSREALVLAETANPDLVITDLTLPDRNGLELIKDLRPRFPDIVILVVSMHDELLYAQRTLRAGARGYLMKENSDDVIPAVRQVLSGEIYVSPAVMRHFMEGLSEGERAHFSFPLARLSDRELQVFELIGQGEATDRIARQLHISERTVDAHRTHIRLKLGLPDSNALLRYAVRWVESGKLD